MTIFGAILFASVILTSCGGGSIESDAKKVAEVQCELQQILQKASTEDMSIIAESTKLTNEAASLIKEMEGKYTSDSDKKKFGEALLIEIGKCN